ncbi:MAG: hypothetical protein AAF243_13520 [Cyanobacteria bacterium P01_A01_bin.137]
MPFLPLFIVIGIFLAISKTFQPSQQHLQSASRDSRDYDEQLLNQALIDYIARESRSKDRFAQGGKGKFKAEKHSNKGKQRR